MTLLNIYRERYTVVKQEQTINSFAWLVVSSKTGGLTFDETTGEVCF